MVNWMAYMAVTIPAAAIVWILMFLFFRYCTKCDMSKLENIDFDLIESMKPAKMNAREIFFTVGFIALIAVWLIPATISLFDPTSPIVTFFNDITLVTPLLVLLVIFCVVRIGGEPVLNINEAATHLNWGVYFMMAGVMLTSNALSADATGIIPFVIMHLGSVVQGLSPFVFVVVVIVISIILTNVLNNIPVAIILMNAAVPLAMEMGMNPMVVGVAIMFSAGMAFALPSSFVPIGCCYAEPFGGPKYTIKYGSATMVIGIVVSTLLIYPLASLIFSGESDDTRFIYTIKRADASVSSRRRPAYGFDAPCGPLVCAVPVHSCSDDAALRDACGRAAALHPGCAFHIRSEP
jgi:sodium-dependent dicarboxylate transporter 2/3/5